ncbi:MULTISPECIES: hypothetical protein [Burkholderiales]|jgi:hypothetical protein|uniref:Uncharacterized protein n=1 Tax=Sphaerotilus microaerophilus TaxID=2914710 RepID=A0ABN6PQI4_9BURK|nr:MULTISPECIES: hypothetical protein [Burkholderiales]BDI06333.1 hypothetical protein CATMQ487_33030 [Sphaerotilus sp. FB-5]
MHALSDPRSLLANAAAPTAAPLPAAPGAAGPESAISARMADVPAPMLPAYVAQRLDDASLLAGVPIRYLVPDPRLLQTPGDHTSSEALRFFHIDAAWISALRRGLLSAASPDGREFVDVAVPVGHTGVILSSSIVRLYPALRVRAWTGVVADGQDPDDPASGATPVGLLRAERLTPSVLVCVFARSPDLVVFEEPHAQVRLGAHGGTPGQVAVALRDNTGAFTNPAAPVLVDVPMRGVVSDGVVDVAVLASRLGAALSTALPSTRRPPDPSASSAGLALQLMQAPGRQRYRRSTT